MKRIVTALIALCAAAGAASCETDNSQYDGVSRFAENPATLPRDRPAPPLPEIPGRTDQDTGENI
jgi:hypothetical protein